MTWIDAERVMAPIARARPGRSSVLALVRYDGTVMAAVHDPATPNTALIERLASGAVMRPGASKIHSC